MKTIKNTHQLRKGDRIAIHGAVFLITSDPCLSGSHPPENNFGPSAVVRCDSICESGEAKPYFWPGSSWTVQGGITRTFTCI